MRLNQRSLLPAGALLLHELILGHHFQLNLQEENQDLPAFRRIPLHLAYTEGWGNYSSALGQEMGVYENLYEICGMLMTDMRHSVRLVVDTGMNAMGWSRERAMEYMREHGVDSEAQIESESCAGTGSGVQDRQPRNLEAGREGRETTGGKV